MQPIRSSMFLRRVLLIDAVSSAGMAAALLLFATTLADLLSLPADLISEAGLVLIPFAVFVGYLATREHPSRVGVWAVIALNAVWTIDSILLLFTSWIQPNVPGYAFVIGQAIVVGVFAELEYIGVRKSVAAHA
ncbi:MAG: hypothetical protein ACREV5_19405 [Steroidobacter sp.]